MRAKARATSYDKACTFLRFAQELPSKNSHSGPLASLASLHAHFCWVRMAGNGRMKAPKGFLRPFFGTFSRLIIKNKDASRLRRLAPHLMKTPTDCS